jgi:hypothetical protein
MLQPRAAIMNNGTRKGGFPDVTESVLHGTRLRGSVADALVAVERPGVRGAWGVIANGVHDQPSALAVAPMPLPAPGSNATPAPVPARPAYWINVSAQEEGTFTVTNANNNFSKVTGLASHRRALRIVSDS